MATVEAPGCESAAVAEGHAEACSTGCEHGFFNLKRKQALMKD